MRRFAAFHVLMLGIVAWAAWQSVAHRPEPISAPPQAAEAPAQPAVQAAAEATKVETPAAQTAAEPAKPEAQPAQAAAAPSAKPAEQPAFQTASEPAAKPAEQAAVAAPAGPAAKPVEQPAAQTAAQPEAKPAEQQAAIQPAAKQDEPTASAPATQPVSLPAAETPAQSAAQPPAPEIAKPETQEAAAGCPGNPDAIGTSRVMTISPGEFTLLGTIQYKQTLPLKDHEVVLTFDDGPIPPYTTSVLDTLAKNCVRATYFLVGEMAGPRPYLVRRIYNEGHSIGTHSQHHPFAFQRLSMQKVEREVDGGIDSVKGALGDSAALSPFFRIPGFGRTNAIDQYLEDKKLVVWSADVDTDDWWRGSTPSAIVQRAMRRLNEKGRGIILMHDIHPATALALPLLLKELKANGYHIVHVVAAGEQPKSLPEVVATSGEKEGWPRGLRADNNETGSVAKKALRHRVKLALNHKGRHRGGKQQEADKVDYANTSQNGRHFTRSY